MTLPDITLVEWQQEVGFDSFNCYRGNLQTLRASGAYTQDPQTDPLVIRTCDIGGSSVLDGPILAPGQVVFYLVTGNDLAAESSLGTDSAGIERPNDNPCP